MRSPIHIGLVMLPAGSVMSARPTRIREQITVPFPYPRPESVHETREFNELRSHVRDLVMKEYAAQASQQSVRVPE